MPIAVQITPVQPVQVTGIIAPAVQVQINPIPPVELVQRTDGSGGTTNWIVNEIPIGDIDGVNAEFMTMHSFIPGTVNVYLNGQRLKQGDDYNTMGLTMLHMYVSPGVGEVILVDYQI